MKLKTQLLLGVNVLVIGSMAGIFAVHIHEEKKQLEKIRAEIQAEIDATVEEAQDAYETAQAALARVEFEKQRDCLATNIYHEASVEGDQGKRAVAWTTINRVFDEKYPNTICEVVYQANLSESGEPIRGECQFSWYCDGKSDEILSHSMWNRSVKIAEEVMLAYGKEMDPTGGAVMYHADYVDPFWVESYDKTVQIDTHIFYSTKGQNEKN